MPDRSGEEILRSCIILGLSESDITRESVMSAWRKCVSTYPPPDSSDDYLITLNVAKDLLLAQLE